jgi:hypothetical protein
MIILLPPRCHEDQEGLTALLAIRPLTMVLTRLKATTV